MRSRTTLRLTCSATLILAVLVVQPVLASANVSDDVKPTWLVLVYLDGDNNLDVTLGSSEVGVVQEDLNELMRVGSTVNVDAFTLVDRFDGPAVLYRVLHDDLEEMTDYQFHEKEVNMGDPRTLRSFVSYAFNMSEAEQTIIIFWDHGTPYYIALDDHPDESAEAVSDSLTHKEVITALEGYHIDILAADECLVGQVEVAYEYAMFADVDYLVASECYTGWRGIAYDRILEEIDTDPGITPHELSEAMTEHFTEMFSVPPYKSEIVNSKAAVDLGLMDELAASICGLAEVLAEDIDEYTNALMTARCSSQILYGTTAVSRVDLGNFIEVLSENVADHDVKAACSSVLSAYAEAVFAVGTTMITEPLHTGLGIYFPIAPNHSLEEFMLGGSDAEYRSYAFPQLGWMTFIETCWDAHGGAKAGAI
jgi:hypothetical protein